MAKNLIAIALILTSVSAGASTYSPNFVWQRWFDWTPGTLAGSSNGNSDSDQAGSPVWRYGYLTGGSLQSEANPWYKNDAQLAVWDDAWWGSNVGGVWARNYFGPDVDNDNANPPIDRYTLWHDVSSRTHSSQYTSAVDWLNPVGDGAVLNISGKLSFQWYGQFSSNSPLAPVEGVVAKYDSSSDSFQTLWSGRFINPKAGESLTQFAQLDAPLTLVGVRFDSGDYLRVTLRADTPESSTPLWFGMRDGLYMRLVSVVPEPSTCVMFLVGLVGLISVAKRTGVQQLRN